MPMLDPLATFLLRVQNAGNDVTPAAALFRSGRELTTDQQEMAEQLARRAHDRGLIEETGSDGDDGARVAVTAAGEQLLAELGL